MQPAHLDALTAIAIDAGRAILDVYGAADHGVAEKDDGSPVSRADTAAERLILTRLADVSPQVPVVAEEAVAAGHVPEIGTLFYLVDPLDGTREFLSRNGEFTVNIAVVADGVPIRGIVHAPATGEIFGGDAGGAWRARVEDGTLTPRRAIHAARPQADGLVVVASRSHLTDETRAFIDRFPVRSFSAAGSSLKFCRVACGEADLYPRLGRTMEWDTAAGDAVLRAAGGSVRTLDGAPLVYGKRGRPDDADFANPWFVAAGLFDPFLELAGAGA